MSNNDSIEVSSSTVEQAISEALSQLGAAQDDVIIEVLATPRSGVLGLGARDARVRVSRRNDVAATSGVTAPPPAPPPQRRAEPAPPPPRLERPRRDVPAPVAAQQAKPPAEPAAPRESITAQAAPARPAQSPRPPREARPEREQQQRSRPPLRERQAESDADDLSADLSEPSAMEDVGDADRRPANLDEQVKEASDILKQILELMGENSEIQRGEGDHESLELDIKGDGSGLLIGRHGQTLDALEYILNRIVARRIKDAMPLLLDTESYRARRRQQLHRMALSMGERAKREHESMKLDPMPPRDRRIVHLALKDDPMITTRSAGEGFLRSVEIVPVGGGERERGNRGRDNRRDRERPNPQERPRERERASNQPALGEQGGFKHGQKRLF